MEHLQLAKTTRELCQAVPKEKENGDINLLSPIRSYMLVCAVPTFLLVANVVPEIGR